MPLAVTETCVKNILTRTGGFLRTVTSHSLQPYCGCAFGNSLCGVGCYVRHNGRLLRGRQWGSFLEARVNAADSYLANHDREAQWARRRGEKGDGHDGLFSIFCSSSTDPFVPQEERFRITRSVLEAMCRRTPDRLILQTHTHRVIEEIDLLSRLAERGAISESTCRSKPIAIGSMVCRPPPARLKTPRRLAPAQRSRLANRRDRGPFVADCRTRPILRPDCRSGRARSSSITLSEGKRFCQTDPAPCERRCPPPCRVN